jgi:hypothetical protein
MNDFGKIKKMTNKNKRANKPTINQQDKSSAGKSTSPPKITVPWGRGASEYRPGVFTKKYFEKHGEACAADIYRSLTEKIKTLNEERVWIGDTSLRRPNYSSFSRYFHWFLIMGLIERTGRREPANYNFLQKKVFYRLTEKGKAETKAWGDPISVKHPEFRKTKTMNGIY